MLFNKGLAENDVEVLYFCKYFDHLLKKVYLILDNLIKIRFRWFPEAPVSGWCGCSWWA